MAKISETYIRQAFLARFARMGRESQEAVIEAMETIRDGTNLTEEYPPVNGLFPERTPGAATILGGESE